MKKFLAGLLVICSVGMIAGCGATSEGSTSETIVDVRAYKAGYDTVWLKSASEKFNDLYKDKGYKINIVEETNSVSETASMEIKDVANNNIDLYFINGVDIADYVLSSAGIMFDGELLVEDLSDVYSAKAIKFDGKEENVTIESKLHEANKRF